MNIGVFDSGLGGLFITKSLIKDLPKYNYIYLGDSKRVPYGNRSPETIYEFLKESVQYLFENECKIVIVACNTASAQALRRIQQEFLPKNYPDRRVLGVIIPTCEVVAQDKKIKSVGVLATQATVESNAFIIELKKVNKNIKIIQQPAPLLVPFIETDSLKFVNPILESYLKPLKGRVDAIILGCTHYPILKKQVKNILGKKVKVISQDEFMAEKLKYYLLKNPEIENKLGKNSLYKFKTTDLTLPMKKITKLWFGKVINLEKVSFDN